MNYNFQKDFFLVHDDDTGETKLFRHWRSVVEFLTDDIMKNGYNIFYDNEGADPNFPWMGDWRAPKDREECFNLLFNVENMGELNDILENFWHTELIQFSD